MTGQVLQDHREVDQVFPPHDLVLGRGDLLVNQLDCRKRTEFKPKVSRDGKARRVCS